MSREDVELYVSGNFDGDAGALERAIADDPALAAIAADEARFELLLRDAAAAAMFCVACDDLVRGERCDACGAAVRPGGYVVERVLVSNAHGRMYVARDADGKQVALKELAFVQAPSIATIEAFEREAKLLRALEHPQIPRFVASFEEGRGVHTRYYLAQELVDGEALGLDEHWYSEAEIADIARQVLAILVYLQSLSPMVIHRDIKPANLLRRADGSIALVDFGAAYVHGSTAGVTTVGTFGYMPVEQLAGIVDATTDLYALGASLLHLLTRQEPWKLAQSKTTANVSAPLRAWLDKLVAADPRDRFASATDALAALERRDSVRPRRRPAWLRGALIAAIGLAASGAGIFMVHALDRGDEPAPPVVARRELATLRLALPDGVEAELHVDGHKVAAVRNGAEVPVGSGRHRVKVLGPGGARCEQDLELQADKVMTIECMMQAALPPAERLRADKLVEWSFANRGFHDAMLEIAGACGFNVVVPDHVDAKISVQLARVPCKDAVEALLEAHGLWYDYDAAANLVRVAPRRALDAERAEAAARGPSTHPALPAGSNVTLGSNRLPLRETLSLIAAGGPHVNLVIPEHVDGGKVTFDIEGVPWERAFEAVLEAHGLWYRYRENGRIVRVAPRRQLDAEDAARP